MENQIVNVFENTEFGIVRTVIIDGEPWFVGKDVAEILGYKNTRQALATHVDIRDKTTVQIVDSGSNYKTNAVAINESGVYSLVLDSKLPQAKEIRHWFTSDVLPILYKTGSYVSDKKQDSYLIENPAARARRWAEEYEEKMALEQENKRLESKIQEDKPNVEFANHVADTSDCIDISTLAKLAKKENIKIGRNRLFEWLRKNDYLMSKGKHKNEPYQKYIDNGWFVVTEYVYHTAYGEQIGTKTYVTGKGQMCIIERLRKAYQNTII